MSSVLETLATVIQKMTVETAIGRILMPGPTYLGMWARDTAIVALGINRLGMMDLSGELLRRYWSFQIDENSDPTQFVIRNKRFTDWTEAAAFVPRRRQLEAEIGAFPTSVYIQTPDFPAGTREIYGLRADLDSVGWLIVALADYFRLSGDEDTVQDLLPGVRRAITYLRSRDTDGDHLLEQGANEDWADVLLRRGKVSYSQAVWYTSLRCAAALFRAGGDPATEDACLRESELVRAAINRILLLPEGFYANYIAGDNVSSRRSLDTSLLVAFGVADDGVGEAVLETLWQLDGPFGMAVVEPGYSPADMGPARYPPGQYQNEGSWPWITSYFVLALAKSGRLDRAREAVAKIVPDHQPTTHEWVDTLSGVPHHPDFATGAGALAWAITEGGLVPSR